MMKACKNDIGLKTSLLSAILLLCTLSSMLAQSSDSLTNDELDKINRALENPLSRYWSVVFQENLNIKEGDLLGEPLLTSVFFFQPALPVPLGKSMMLTARPVFPLVSNPVILDDGTFGSNTTGFGDLQLLTVVGPDKKSSFVWGLGATFIFPTASASNLGQGKYQLGPSLLLMFQSSNWTLGLLGQHWNSIGGQAERENTSHTDLQYIVRRRIPGAASLGVGPTISINWLAEEGERLVFPIGLGYVKTIKAGRMPVKIKIEPQYNLIRPSAYASTWMLRLQITPVIRSPFITF